MMDLCVCKATVLLLVEICMRITFAIVKYEVHYSILKYTVFISSMMIKQWDIKNCNALYCTCSHAIILLACRPVLSPMCITWFKTHWTWITRNLLAWLDVCYCCCHDCHSRSLRLVQSPPLTDPPIPLALLHCCPYWRSIYCFLM